MKSKGLFSRTTFWLQVIIWAVIFIMPISFKEPDDELTLTSYLRHSVLPLCLMLVFYVNYLWLGPKFFSQSHRWKKLLSVDLIFIAVLAFGLSEWMTFDHERHKREIYAIDGYKVNAVDYLLKPISYDDFLRATTKVSQLFSSADDQDSHTADRFIFVKSEYKLLQVRFDDILFVEGLKDYVKIYMDGNQKPIMSLMNLKKLEESLPSPEFMRTHRSYIVHMSKVRIIDRFRIVFGNNYIPISDSYKDSVQQYLDSHTPM